MIGLVIIILIILNMLTSMMEKLPFYHAIEYKVLQVKLIIYTILALVLIVFIPLLLWYKKIVELLL